MISESNALAGRAQHSAQEGAGHEASALAEALHTPEALRYLGAILR